MGQILYEEPKKTWNKCQNLLTGWGAPVKKTPCTLIPNLGVLLRSLKNYVSKMNTSLREDPINQSFILSNNPLGFSKDKRRFADKCKPVPGMCPHRFGCILPHSGPSSQCKNDSPIFFQPQRGRRISPFS